MKKFVYLCAMMLLSANMMAQIDLNDSTWNRVFHDEFTESGRYWHNWSSRPDKKWRGYPGYGVTSNSGHQVFQYSNCHFNDTDGTMELVAEYDKDTLIPRNLYHLPKWMWPEYGGSGYPCSDNLFYFSGEIDARKDSIIGSDFEFRFGYFEIRCKFPKHQGAHPAFWLQGADTASPDAYYEEIDIFEYSWSMGNPNAYWLVPVNPNPTYTGDPRVYSTAICHNLHGHGVCHETDNYAGIYPRLPNGQEDISGWHTYSCEWMPDHVYWYLDGNLVNSYFDKTHIPRHSLTLKTSYAIDDNYYHDSVVWMDSDTLTIDYIRVYQLGWDCDTDEVIACQNDLTGFDFKVKKSVAITSSIEEVEVGDDDKITFRVADSFEITGPFQADSGCEFTVIRQDCPE